MTDVIYLAGAERSGTNYLEWLLKKNFKDAIIIVMWKHYPPRDFIKHFDWNNKNQQENYNKYKREIEDFLVNISKLGRSLPPFSIISEKNSSNVIAPAMNKVSPYVQNNVREAIVNGTMKFVINVKNPYGWHLSYTNKWKKYRFPDSMKKWTSTYSRWLDFCKKYSNNSIMIKHEDLLRNFSKELEKIYSNLNLKKSGEKFENTNKLMTTICSTKNTNFKKLKYYMNELYMDDLKKNKVNLVKSCRKHLPDELMKELGYEKI